MGRRLYNLVMGDEMGVSWIFVVAGLAAAGLGLSSKSPWINLAAPAGWLIFLAGLVQIMVPGFWR